MVGARSVFPIGNATFEYIQGLLEQEKMLR